MEAVRRLGDLLRYASEELRGDRAVAMEAVKHWLCCCYLYVFVMLVCIIVVS